MNADDAVATRKYKIFSLNQDFLKVGFKEDWFCGMLIMWEKELLWVN